MKLSKITSYLILAVMAAVILPVANDTRSMGTSMVFAAGKEDKKFALNFKDVEIDEFVNIMSQLIGKNIILDEKVKGKITINSVRKVPVSQAYQVMKSILEIKGFAVVEMDNIVKILPIKDAVKKNTDIIVDLDGQKKPISLTMDESITYIQEIMNADAEEVANALKQLKAANTDLIVYPNLNLLIYSGLSTEIEGLIKIAKTLDKKIGEGETDKKKSKGLINVVHLQNANAEELGAVLARIPFSETALIDTSTPDTGGTPEERQSKKAQRTAKTQYSKPDSKQKLSIVANKETNSLIITATPQEYIEIERIITALDTVREQVFIEALIMEVSAENGWGFGIDWMLGAQSGQNGFGGSSMFNPINEITPPKSFANKNMVMPLTQGFTLGYIRDGAALGFALLNASASRSDINIISTPQILTIDNQEAELNVGEEIPVMTTNRISDTGTQNQTFDYKTVGMKLKITPHITKSKSITLDLYQEVNSVLGETTNPIVPPKLGKRDIKTKVNVIDGRTIVVGGLIRNDRTSSETKVPLLGDIPLLGWLFKTKSVQYTKKNLLIFITPHIVTKEKQIEGLTKEKLKIHKRMKEKYLKESNW